MPRSCGWAIRELAAIACARRMIQKRWLLYLNAHLTGLRRDELGKLTWGYVYFETSAFRVQIDAGKAQLDDFVPLYPQSVEECTAFSPTTPSPRIKSFTRSRLRLNPDPEPSEA